VTETPGASPHRRWWRLPLVLGVAGLIVALTAGGAPVAAATAAVLAYRLLACWALLPVGAACWAGLRRSPAIS
jgi:uncharacterized membrane protein YbhN (UPF0104 family)